MVEVNRARHSRGVRRLLLGGLLVAAGLIAPASAQAVSCPNPNPVVNENNCMGAGTDAWRLSQQTDAIAGYSTQTSYDLGQDIPLRIARDVPMTSVDIAVYRTGYYGNLGGREITAAGHDGVVVNNSMACNAPDATTGEYDCGNWVTTYTIPGGSLPASGVYVAKLTASGTGDQNWIVFVVRDDHRATPAKVLDVLPTATWQAYNNWGGKSLYFDSNGGPPTVAGTDRAVKVSFNRPLNDPGRALNRYTGPDFSLVAWLEQQGYDVAYTDDPSVHANPTQLLSHKIVVISGHSEYWSLEEYNAIKAARDAGVSVASFSANTAYWKVRYENGGRRLVCYKTVEGSGSGGDGSVSANDWGPDGAVGTADDALGADGVAGTGDDNPQNATTTFRDNGAPPGDPNAPAAGRVGPDMPENALFGVMYVGDHDFLSFPLTVPAANAAHEFAGDRAWRNTDIATGQSTAIGTNLVGWEWDAVPTQAQYLTRQPAGVQRLSASDTTAVPPASWLQDEGRARSTVPPLGQPSTVNAVRYSTLSGAQVFASGTMQWSYGLAGFYAAPQIPQATYNILSDMGVQPGTPAGVTLDPPNRPPTAVVKAAPASGGAPLSVAFDGSGSTDPDVLIARYDWDLDGDGAFDDGLGPHATFTYPARGTYGARLRVTDPPGESSVASVTIQAGSSGAPLAGGVLGRRSLARIRSARLVHGRTLVVRVACLSAARTACTATVAATVKKHAAGKKRVRGLKPGRSTTVRVTLTRAARVRLKRKGTKVVITLTVRDAKGAGATVKRTLRRKG